MQLIASIQDQTLSVLDDANRVVKCYPISTAIAGTGSEEGSYCTPIGRFEISEKHGDGSPVGTIFRSRKPVGLWSPEEPPANEDLVLTRILWLQGLEPHNANTKERYIYIHGTNHEDSIGTACSAGCLRMKNQDVIELYDLVQEGTTLTIQESPHSIIS